MQKKLFGKVGIEPTYFPATNLIMPQMHDFKLIEIMWQSYIAGISNILSPNHKELIHYSLRSWILNHESCDGGGCEFPTNTEFDDIGVLVKLFGMLNSWLYEKANLLPSSMVSIETEGGCHVNIDLSRVIDCEKTDVIEFQRNLAAFLNSVPGIVWMCLSPNDNESSKIKYLSDYSTTEKGDCINNRDEYMELRFFVMPADELELEFHLNLANAIMWYIFEETQKGSVFTFKNTRQSLAAYTYDKALEETLQALKTIGISAEDAMFLGKFDELKTRISYGKYWLV